ncbi:hypothetical protein AN639_00185 [Candidatus Epulonipiscium fishelsonii]|nr:hypothetical protein AN639_00185 [Epulopiscium sp. SCG-B05WGA-EpuloA1]
MKKSKQNKEKDTLYFSLNIDNSGLKKWEQLHFEDVDDNSAEEYLTDDSGQDEHWKINIKEIDFETLLKNRISRENIKPSYYPENIIEVLFKDIVFKSAFGVIVQNYNPIKNICALLNTVFKAVRIDKKLKEECVSTNHLPQFSTMEEFLANETMLAKQSISNEVTEETSQIEKPNIKVKRYNTPDILLIDGEDQVVTEMQTNAFTKLWHRIIQNQSVTHALSKEKGYSIWFVIKEFPEPYKGKAIMIVSNVISSFGHENLNQEEFKIDKRDTNGCAIIIDIFHPDMYKINRELALW